MSLPELHALLVDADQAGAFYLTAADLAPIRQAAEGLDFHVVALDLSGQADKVAVLEAFARAFDFPDWFGHNWDALADSLTDLPQLVAPGVVLAIEGPGAFRDAHPDDYATLVSILEDASLQWRERNLPFWTFIALPGDDFETLQS